MANHSPAEEPKAAIPADLDVERCLLGSILLRPDLLRGVRDIVAAADFYRPRHGRIFDAAVVVGDPVDPLQMVRLVHDELMVVGPFQSSHADAMELIGLMIDCPYSDAAPAYALRVRELARARRAMSLIAPAFNALAEGRSLDDILPLLHEAVAV